MHSKVLDQVKALTLADDKNLSQKLAKAMEELGELSKIVLPYENAAGTLHRFVVKSEILEECVDNILCHLSMIYELGFSDEDIESMMVRKLSKWQQLQLQEKGVTGSPIPFEVHITVEMTDQGEVLDELLDNFRSFCKVLEVKPIILDLHCTDRSIIQDVMTSSVYFGDNTGAMEYAENLGNKLKIMGYTVLRTKIETVPWHPAAPQSQGEKMPDGGYFESHLAVICTVKTESNLRDIINSVPSAHLSRNKFKNLAGDCYIMMITLRTYDGHRGIFEGELKDLSEKITESGFEIEKEIVEFSIYDDKNDHDQLWLKK